MTSNYNDFSVLAGNQVILSSGATNSVLTGDFGSYNNYSGTGTINGQIYTGSDVSDALITASSDCSIYLSLTPDITYTQSDIGGLTFTPGIIQLSNAGTVTLGSISGSNTITFNGDGYYYIQIPNGGFTTSTTLANVNMNLTNGAKASKIYWYISGSVNLQSQSGNVTNSVGTILSQGDVVMGVGSRSICSIISISGYITLNNNMIWSTTLRAMRDVSVDGYINIESTLADNEAITIDASSTYGGVLIESGIGGIEMDTTNGLVMNANAQSGLTVSTGNIVLDAVQGLVNISSGSGININSTNNSSVINIGTSSVSEQINIGNNNTSTNITANAGTISVESWTTGNNSMQAYSNGGIDVNAVGIININSASTLSNALTLYSSGGLSVSTAGSTNITSGSGTSNSITLDSTYNNGGIELSSGTQGIILSSNGGYIALGSFSGGTIYIGTANIARSIQVGNTTGNTSINISSGTGGIAIGNDNSTGEIQLGNVASSKTIIIGNNSGSTGLITRYGTGGFIKSQGPQVTLTDANVTVTTQNLLNGILYMTTGSSRTVTLPNASDIITAIPSIQVSDCIDFSVIYNVTNILGGSLTVAMGTGGTMIGQNSISGLANLGGLFYGSLSGMFRLSITNVSTPSYTVYRMS